MLGFPSDRQASDWDLVVVSANRCSVLYGHGNQTNGGIAARASVGTPKD